MKVPERLLIVVAILLWIGVLVAALLSPLR